MTQGTRYNYCGDLDHHLDPGTFKGFLIITLISHIGGCYALAEVCTLQVLLSLLYWFKYYCLLHKNRQHLK